MAATAGPSEPGADFNTSPSRSGSRHHQDMATDPELEAESSGRAASPSRPDQVHPKQKLEHILTSSEDPINTRPRSPSQVTPTKSSDKGSPTNKNVIWIDGGADTTENGASTQNDSYTRAAEFNPSHTMTVAHIRRNANGTIGSVYSGNKIRHLKKEDGIPLWRKDIQLEFLRCVFDDETPCFTKSFDGTKGHTFADIYVDAMARSSKTSKILKEKLLADRPGAMSMAMICLLVNVGRMNTTLNFFPEMRAQLRTYHAIPSLQANQDPNAYKQLQDAPRLKSILKGASEDISQPSTIDRIKAASIPRSNPVNLIFVLSQYAPKISEIHFHPPRDFFDLVMRATLSSKSRAKSFLWLIWWYLESDFTAQAALDNPFGPGQHGDQTGSLPLKVPAFEHLTEEQANAENVDSEAELIFGEMKRLERRRILEEDETVGPPLKKTKKNPKNEEGGVIAISDTEPTRSPSPSYPIQPKPSIDYSGPSMLTNGASEVKAPPVMRYQPISSKAHSSNPQRLVLKTRPDLVPGSSPPAPPGSGHPTFSGLSNGNRRSRPETSHQKAVNINRKMRTDHILHKQMVIEQRTIRKEKRKNSNSFGMMVMNRVRELPEMYDTEDEHSWGPGGLMPSANEAEDYGEEAIRHKKVIDRAIRRLFRDENGGSLGGLVKGYRKRKRKSRGYLGDDDGHPSRKRRKGSSHNGLHGNPSRDSEPREEGLDDLDLDLLGEHRDEDQSDDGSGAEGSGGDDGDMTEEDVMIEG